MEEFKAESLAHGWPSFRPEEAVHENVKILEGGEMVSVCGTHLGHDIPDESGPRYCINLICMAGQPPRGAVAGSDESAWKEAELAESGASGELQEKQEKNQSL